VNDDMTIIRSAHAPVRAYPPPELARGVKTVLNAPFSPSLCHTGAIESKLAIDTLKNRNARAVGIVGRAFISAGFMQQLKEALPGIEFVDLTDEIDEFKALKSEEEMSMIREITAIQDKAWAALPAIVKPEMREYQIRAELTHLLMDLGSEEHLIFIGTAEPMKPSGLSMANFSNRRFKAGDYGIILIEVSGTGGYYAESARNFCTGEPYKELAAAWDAAVKGQQLTADLLTPGRDSREIVKAYNEFIEPLGYCKEGRLYGHSQGYDLIERPAFMSAADDEESMIIQAGMNCSLHPFIINDILSVYINDNFYVTENGAERLHQTPQEIIII